MTNNIKLLFELVDPSTTDETFLPSRAHDGDVGFDLKSAVDITILPFRVAVVKTGIKCVYFHENHGVDAYPKLESRSGLATKGVWTIGGVIDKKYRGEWGAILFNSTDSPYSIKKGDRITQMVITRVVTEGVEARLVDEYDILPGRETTRGAGGFGSTGG